MHKSHQIISASIKYLSCVPLQIIHISLKMVRNTTSMRASFAQIKNSNKSSTCSRRHLFPKGKTAQA